MKTLKSIWQFIDRFIPIALYLIAILFVWAGNLQQAIYCLMLSNAYLLFDVRFKKEKGVTVELGESFWTVVALIIKSSEKKKKKP